MVTILKQIEEFDEYVPQCNIWVSTRRIPEVLIEIALPQKIKDYEVDFLRVALKQWAKKCNFGELAEGGALAK